MTSFGRTAIAAVVAAGLFGYIYFVESKKEPPKVGADGDSMTAKREKVFTGFDKLKVKSITLKKRNGDVVEAEKNGETWMLVSPKETAADTGEIGTLLDSLQTLETEEIVADGATDLEAYGLKQPKVAVSVVAEGATKPFEFELGDTVPAGSGLFARVPGNPRLFTVSSTLENTLSKSAFDLRDRNLFKVKREQIQSMEVFDKGKDHYKLVRGAKGDDEWKLETPVKSRTARWAIDSTMGLIENLKMESIASEEATPTELTKYGLGATPDRRVVMILEGGKTLQIDLGKKTDDGKYYARDTSSKTVAVIPPALIEDLDKGLKNVRSVRLLDIAAYEVTAFDVTVAGATKTFTKATVKGKDGVDQITWKSTAPVKDATQEKASDALFGIGSLEATEFLDAPKPLGAYGLDAPALKVTLRFEGEKVPDWFEITVQGEEAFARRRDDLSVLKLDKAKAEALIKSFTSLGA